MAFKNEYVPPLEQETSEFFKKARETLRTGHSKFDEWTVDREREMVLKHSGSGHEMESADLDIWAYIDQKGHYVFSTEQLSRTKISSEEISITYRLKGFWGDGNSSPDFASIYCIKEALREDGRRYLFNQEAYRQCRLTLIDGITGKEI